MHTNVVKFLEGFRHDAHPMGMLLGAVGALYTVLVRPFGGSSPTLYAVLKIKK